MCCLKGVVNSAARRRCVIAVDDEANLAERPLRMEMTTFPGRGDRRTNAIVRAVDLRAILNGDVVMAPFG